MNTPLRCLVWLLLVATGFGAVRPDGTTRFYTAKEIAQGYREHVVLAQPRAGHRSHIDAEEASEHVNVRAKFEHLGDIRVIELDASESVDAAIQRLNATGRYAYVAPDYLRYLSTTPNDPKFTDGTLWAFNNTGQSGGTAGNDINAVQGWGILHDAPSVVVAIVDTGVNLTHQDLAGNLWTNPSPSAKNDLHGANFVGGHGAMVSGDPTDDDGHGTHLAGTIGGVGNNGLAVTGVAWKVKLMAVKSFPPNAPGADSDIVGGINYAVGHGATIINASFGAEGSNAFSPNELAAMSAARDAGVIIVAAAGNSTLNLDLSRAYPADYPLDNIVTVAACDRYGEVSSFSNYGAAVDLVAPGEDITSLDYASNTGTAVMSGTSMAAPHVAGALALLKAQFPTDTYRQLINRLLRGVTHTTAYAGKAQTGGMLNLYGALTTTSNRPFNDGFADRPTYKGANLSIRTSNTGATPEVGEPAHAGNPASATLWWEWVSPTTGAVSVNTSGSNIDTVLAVYTGTSVGALTPVASNDNDASALTSRLTFDAVQGTAYEIAVDGKNGASGLILLNLGATPANDAFAKAVALSGRSTQVTASNANCSREPGEPVITASGGGDSVWYQWTAPSSGAFQIAVTSTDFDPLLAVYTGSTLGTLQRVPAQNNLGTGTASQTPPVWTVQATAGTTYAIVVDTTSSSSVGEFTLSIVDSAWQAVTGGAITSSPAVAMDGTIYVGSQDYSLHAFNPDGSQKWAYATSGFIDSCSPAVADDGTVYVGSSDGKVYAIAADGSLKWAHNFRTGTAVISAGCSPAVAADGTIYTRTSDGYLHALSPADGAERWMFNLNAPNLSFYGNPVIGSDGTIYAGSDENDHTFYAITPAGALKWKVVLDAGAGVYGAPAIDASGNLYVTTLNGGVYSFAADRTQRWHVASGGNISSSVALSADGTTLYYAGYDKLLYARNTTTGAARWTYPLGAEVRASSPAIDANGVIYVGCYDHKLYAVNADGTRNREYDTGDWIRSAPAIAGNRLYVGSNDEKLYAFDLAAGPASGAWPQYRFNARRIGRTVQDQLAIALQPQGQTAILGQSLSLTVGATGQSPLSYQWKKDGVAVTGATSATYTVANVTAAAAGTYTVTVSGPQGTITSAPAVVTVAAANPGRLFNLSVRTTAGADAQKLTVGFAVSGAPKKLLIRGVGPTLANYGVTDALAAPVLEVISMTSFATVASNTKWGGSQTLTDAFNSVGAFSLPAASADDALIFPLPTNGTTNYSVWLTGANGAVGTGLVELYDLDGDGATNRLKNVSARAQVGTGGNVLVAGFAISGNVPKQLLIRGIGPALAAYGVTGVLAAPKLTVYADSGKTVVKSNTGWGGDSTLTAAFTATGAFQLTDATSHDTALLVTLQPGVYTAEVSGVNGTTGVALIEVYEMP